MMKAKYSVVLAMLIVIAGVSLVVAASELVTNGDFSNGLSDWATVGNGTAIIDDGNDGDDDCGAGVARLEGTNQAALQQCIVVDDFAQADQTHWTLSADMRLIDGFLIGVAAQFYNNPNCTGSPANLVELSTFATSPDLDPFVQTDDYDPPPNSSVLMVASLNATGTTAFTGCFDNISLLASTPTAITLGSVGAQSGTPSPWAIVLLLAATAIMIATFVAVGRRILRLEA